MIELDYYFCLDLMSIKIFRININVAFKADQSFMCSIINVYGVTFNIHTAFLINSIFVFIYTGVPELTENILTTRSAVDLQFSLKFLGML